MSLCCLLFILFFFNATATTELYTLSLHDALPISARPRDRESCNARASPSSGCRAVGRPRRSPGRSRRRRSCAAGPRSEEHTSELQSPYDLVCRLLLEKKKKKKKIIEY